MNMEQMEELSVPKGVEKYNEADLKLLAGEKVERMVGMAPLCKLRSFFLCGLAAVLGLVFYDFFGKPVATAESLVLPLGIFILTYFVWHYKVTESGKQLVSGVIKYTIWISLISYLITFISTLFGPILEGFNAPNFSLNPLDNIYAILEFITDLANTSLSKYSFYTRLGSLGVVSASLAAFPLLYIGSRGRLYYVTNKRVVVRDKSGTAQVTTLPLDNVVEVTGFQGFFGRLLGYGDVILTVTSGGGVSESLRPKSLSPLGSFYRVKRRLEGLKEIWEVKDLIITLRDKYVQANYLQSMEEELRRIREAVEEKPNKKTQVIYRV
jgi:hypothetical protein